MELLEGETLEARSTRKGKHLPVSEVLPIFHQVLDVLAVAHEKGVVHRDLKPDNLFLTRSGQIKILDFGIARLREVSTNTTQTRAGSVMGTPAFMAPEQARGRWDEVDPRTDIWAAAATMFTLLTGRYVHEGETVQEQLILAATKPPPSIGEILPGLPPSLVEIIDRALAYDKHARWPDARAMQAALRAAHGIEVDAPIDRLTPPTPSSPGFDAQTIVAPAELTSAITGLGSVTGRGFSSSTRAPHPRRRGMVILASVLALAAVGGGTALHLASRVPPVETVPSEPAADPPKAPDIEIGPLATPSAAPDDSAEPTVTAKTAPPATAKPREKTGPRAGQTSSATEAKPNGTPANANPFDRRL
jgi:serine/threonine-protein kinase